MVSVIVVACVAAGATNLKSAGLSVAVATWFINTALMSFMPDGSVAVTLTSKVCPEVVGMTDTTLTVGGVLSLD